MKLYFFLFFLVLLFTLRSIVFFAQQKQYQDGQAFSFTARLLRIPEQRGRVQTFSLQPGGYEPLYLSVPLFPEYEYGQVLHVSGIVKLSEGDKKVFPTMRYPQVTVKENDSVLYGLIGAIRGKVMRIYEGSLSPTAASLLMGIVFGIKQGMSQEFKTALQEVGVFHVVAASGMNVTLIAGFFMVIFGSLLKRQVALVLSIFGIIFYAFLAGLEPSIVRASIMGSIVFLSGILGRQNMALWTLGFTGYLMLLWQPSLISDIGFQLSFLATLGILILKPVIPDLIGVMKFSQKHASPFADNLVSEDLKTTLAAQLGTLPILLSAFGQVNFLSLLVNVLVLWTIPPIMVIGSLAAVVGFISESLGKLIVFLALPFLLYFEWVVLFFARFHWSLHIESFPWWGSVGYYLLLIGFVYLMKKKLSSRAKRGDLISAR